MDVLTTDDLRALMGKRGEVCVSIYMPSHLGGRDIPQDKTRYKNLLNEAGERLLSNGGGSTGMPAGLTCTRALDPETRTFWTLRRSRPFCMGGLCMPSTQRTCPEARR